LSITVEIEKVIHGGSGLARTGQGVMLVSGVIPGERVEITPTGSEHGMMVARLERIVESSRDRCRPICPYFGICGGCDWLFIDYQRQLQLKLEIFSESMRRVGKISSFPEPEIFASEPLGYRRRAQLKIDDAGHIGFFRRASNDVVSIDFCPLLTARLNDLLAKREELRRAVTPGCRSLRLIDGDSAVASSPHCAPLTKAITVITAGGIGFEVAGGDFFQSNRFLLEKICAWISQKCQGQTLADIYGGTGFFSLMLASKFRQGWLVESDREMVKRADRNFLRNSVTSIRAIAAAAESLDRILPKRPDVLIIDPPRPGLTRAVREAVARTAPQSIVYVSCNCATQARDCGFFTAKCVYTITASAMFDFYPNTHHTESVLVLQRAKKA